MSTKVIMPQMGESIAEGTITKWLKKVGDAVERDEPLFEISTDKVDAEIPSPTAGTLLEILAQEGETVEVNTEVAIIGEAGEQPAATPATPEPVATGAAAEPAVAAAEAGGTEVPELIIPDRDELRRIRSSPVVRRIATEHGIDLSEVQGTGISGRVTKQDILAHVERRATAQVAPPASSAPPAPPAAPVADAAVTPVLGPARRDFAGAGELREAMSVMRQRIAERMVESRRIAAHVHTVFDIDLSEVGRLRDRHKAAWKEREGINLTWMPFIQRATVDALKRFPIVNASIDGTDIVYHRDVNLGVAVALEWGLIVPVIRRADELSLLGLARATLDLAERARTKQLNPDEVAGNTFTITNPGAFGGRFGTPIIPLPTVAILGVGAVEKRPVVRHDAIAIRTLCTFSLGFDHRLIDGAVADQFMAEIKKRLEEARFEGLD
jgi:2-oxoglutarate dehydrogenase E2 component (dihydrolipoamide succinyltransferase)